MKSGEPDTSKDPQKDEASELPMDVIKAHSAKREKPEPESGEKMMPIVLLLLIAFILLLGGAVIGMMGGSFSMKEVHLPGYDPEPRPGQGDGVKEEKDWLTKSMEGGENLYINTCVSCHQAGGEGTAGMYPPLNKSKWVTAGTERLAMVLLKGVEGPITVLGKRYSSAVMPSQASLSDKDLAKIMTFIRGSWDNKASPVTAEMVAYAREKYTNREDAYTEKELLKISSEAMLPGEIPKPEGEVEEKKEEEKVTENPEQ